MTSARDAIFVSPAWLAAHLSDPNLVVVDGSYYLPTMNRDAAAEYAAARIPGAVRFDIDAVKDTASPLPHMLPPAEQFAEQVGALGISEDMAIVVYDGLGLFSAPRVRWTFRSYGARDVKILDGGFPAWTAAGLPTESGAPAPRPPRSFKASFDPAVVASLADVKQALADGVTQVVDARPAERFRAEAPEPRPGLPSGHMPGSFSLPFAAILSEGRLKDEAGLKAALAEAGIDPDKPIVTSCGSGVSAAIVSTALELIGKPAKALYDGAWAEWASTPDNPVEAGASARQEAAKTEG